jgi:hypothetical protein
VGILRVVRGCEKGYEMGCRSLVIGWWNSL